MTRPVPCEVVGAMRGQTRGQMRGQTRRGDRRAGVALVVVLWAVVLLATVTAVASSAARSSASVAGNLRAQATARAMAESGIVAASRLIDDSLRFWRANDVRRGAFLDALEPTREGARPLLQDTLADGVFAVTVVDISARLDVNLAGVDGLTRLLATVTAPAAARRMAERIDAVVRGEIGALSAADRARAERLQSRDSVNAMLLGREPGVAMRRPFESLDALRDVEGVDVGVLAQVARFLTVDGDGNVNRRAAPREVLAAATGSLVDAPTRLLLLARGWQRGHPLSRQIEAVYDVTENGLRLVRWREHDL